VGNLQELVYKQGQAGVTKATVTIAFNNADKKASPVGYEHLDRILVTRQVRTTSIHEERPIEPSNSAYDTIPVSSSLVQGACGVLLTGLWLCRAGGDRGQEQVHDQQPHGAGLAGAEPLPLRAAQRQQPPLPHHARPHHQGDYFVDPLCPPSRWTTCTQAYRAIVHPSCLLSFCAMAGAQVLNMKPPEILGMIEEAAGTRMFESKKQVEAASLHLLDRLNE
jgi:hypothetical protein